MEKIVSASRDYFRPGTIFRFRLYGAIVPATRDYLHRSPRRSKLILAMKLKMAASCAFSRKYIFMLLMQCSSFLACLNHFNGLLLFAQLYFSQLNMGLGVYAARRKDYVKEKARHRRLRRLNRKPRSIWFHPGRSDIWWVNMINHISLTSEWKKNFRLTFEQFMQLVEKLRPYLSPDPDSPNYRALEVEKKVAIALYYLKDKGSLRMTSNIFGIQVCTASKIIYEVCKAIAFKLGPELIKLPSSKSEMRQKAAEFEVRYGMVQAFGCIDGTHIQIKRPTMNSQDYYSYKMFYSLNVQAVCDSRGLFMDVDCRWPGSVHDAKVFCNSDINCKFVEHKLPITNQPILPGRMEIPNYLIGDPAYPLTPFSMKEYDTCPENATVVFNNILRSARNPIECAFGRLKARWAFLSSKVDLKLEFVPTAIYACFVLHNYCEMDSCAFDEDLVERQVSKHVHDEKKIINVQDPIYSVNTDEGSVIRDIIKCYIQDNLPDHMT